MLTPITIAVAQAVTFVYARWKAWRCESVWVKPVKHRRDSVERWRAFMMGLRVWR